MKLPLTVCVALASAAMGAPTNAQVGAQVPVLPTVLWSSCRDADALITLNGLAEKAKPILWFSRDEPVTDLQGFSPGEWPRVVGKTVAEKPVVYYRISKLKADAKDEAMVRVLREQVGEADRARITTTGANPEVLANIPLTRGVLQQLRQIVVRYMFYYPNELGAGSHPHDLESAELVLGVESADESGSPVSALRGCRQIRAITLYGAAHGLGLYTNVLDLNEVLKDHLSDSSTAQKTLAGDDQLKLRRLGTTELAKDTASSVTADFTRNDPTWPVVILVEEGKHASAPDRNGDGMFTPNYDVNRYSADAWGARDTMRSRALAPVFRADTFKKRIPEIMVRPGEGPRRADTNSEWAKAMFDRYVRYDYEVRRATSDSDVCGQEPGRRSESERQEALEDYARGLKQMTGHGDPEGLLKGKGFCSDVNMTSHFNGTDFFEWLGVGGQYNGYTRFWERLSGSLRFDGGAGWTGTVPIPLAVPAVGGVVVVRVAGPWKGGSTTRKSIDMLYMPSASRFAEWYVGGGADHGRYHEESGWRGALETGIKFRFPVIKFGTFLGARIGVRTNTGQSLQNSRLVFEAGAGIW